MQTGVVVAIVVCGNRGVVEAIIRRQDCPGAFSSRAARFNGLAVVSPQIECLGVVGYVVIAGVLVLRLLVQCAVLRAEGLRDAR